jgi:hypothetical protein
MATYNTPILFNKKTHMKTTIEVSDALFNAAKELAQASQTTLRALIEDGLRRVLLEAQSKDRPAFRLQDASVQGESILMTDPRQWHSMEEDHVASRAMNSNA